MYRRWGWEWTLLFFMERRAGTAVAAQGAYS
jgi:hypothetical protein